MRKTYRPQRWLEWKNIDTTTNPTCPAFGCIEIVGSELVGAKVVLLGRSATAYEREPSSTTLIISGEITTEYRDNQQGARWNHCFNSEVSVAPGAIGHCTFDLPTWAAVKSVGLGSTSFGKEVTLGKFLEVPVIVPPGVTRAIGEPWRLGRIDNQIEQLAITDEAGWNVYHYDQLSTTQSGNGAALIGGARTFLRAANRRSV